MDTLKNVSRWVLVLPSALLALVLSYALGSLFVMLQSWFIGASPDSGFMKITQNIFLAGLSGYAFVYFGCKVAPNSKKVVAYFLMAICLMLGGIDLFISISHRDIWEMLGGIFPGVGAIFALHQIQNGELDVEGEIFDFN